jgi:hypothetical protein
VTTPNHILGVAVSVSVLYVIHDVQILTVPPLGMTWEEAGSVALRFDLF